MSIVVQHEVSLKKNETHSLALVTDQVSNMKKTPSHKNFGGSKQFKRKGNSNQGTSNASASSNAIKNERFKGDCNFCHKIGHKQADCFKFKNDVVLKPVPLKKNTSQNDAVLTLFSFPALFSGLFEPNTTPNRALALVVQWRSEGEEEEKEKQEKNSRAVDLDLFLCLEFFIFMFFVD